MHVPRILPTCSLILLGLSAVAPLRAAPIPIPANDWGVFAAEGAALSYAIKENDKVRVNVEKPGTEVWHAQLRHPFRVESGHRYRVRFTLSSEEAQGIPIWVQQDRPNFEFHLQSNAVLEGAGAKEAFAFEFFAIQDDSVFLILALGQTPRAAITVLAADVEDLGKDETAAWERDDQRPGGPDFAPRLDFGRRLEPKDSVLTGAGQDLVGYRDYVGALDSADLHPTIFMEYAGLYEDWDARFAPWKQLIETTRERTGSAPALQLGLYLVGTLDRFNADASDAELERIATSLKSLGVPIYLRIGYEPNGSWNAYPPEEYVRAFRRISTYLRERLPDLAVVWCVVAREGGLPAAMKWYPGDDVVDWWGIDLFSVSDLFHPETHDFLIESEKRKFPVMIGESTPRYVGVKPAGEAWDRWFEPFFALVRQQPVIKAFCYINWEWADWSKKLDQDWDAWGDARIETSPDLLPKLREELSLPLYHHLGDSLAGARPEAPSTPTPAE